MELQIEPSAEKTSAVPKLQKKPQFNFQLADSFVISENDNEDKQDDNNFFE